ncbi:hypothetical protein ACTMTI_00200 [Nonomuraea sp. H19]|uniref:hypothetical protein n=1 Tax=Nonomuraea sp. H19 TaxID=3452206 RepID=UPI003F8C9858
MSGDDAAPYDWFADHTDPNGFPLPGQAPAGSAQAGPGAADTTRTEHEPAADQTGSGHGPGGAAHSDQVPAAQEPATTPWAAQGPAETSWAAQEPAETPWAAQGPAEAPQAAQEPATTPWAAQESDATPWAAQGPPTTPWAVPGKAAHAWNKPGKDLPSWPGKPVVPGAPPWEPPPAFTAAAAGMPVWPAPLSDAHAMPPWPAATGELVAEPDAEEPDAPAFAPNATDSDDTRPAHSFNPEAASPEAAKRETIEPRAATPEPAPSQSALPQSAPSQSAPSQEDAPEEGPSQQQETAFLSAPIAPEREDTRPISHADIARPIPEDTTKPVVPFTPNAAERAPAPLFDPGATGPARPAEPGDVPVWPPLPPTSQKLPDLPFARESWGQRPSTSLEPHTPPQGNPTFPPGAFKQPPFQIPPPPPPPGKSKRALLVTLGALALAGVATGGFFAWQSVSSPTPTTAAARPTASAQPSEAAPAASPPVDAPGASVLNSEETDPQKLSLSEAFPKKKVSAAGTTFTRVKADMETSCDNAAAGAFADALKEQKCSRVLRATYVDSKRRYAVTTGIAVLPTKDAATAVDQAKNLSKNVWFRPLPGAAGSGGERVHIAGGYAAGLVWGRYIVFSYATHADGHTPAAKEKSLPKVSSAFRDETSLVLDRRVTD